MNKIGLGYFLIILTGLTIMGCNSTGRVAAPLNTESEKLNHIAQGENTGIRTGDRGISEWCGDGQYH